MHPYNLCTGAEGTGRSQGLDGLVELVSSSLSIDPISKYRMENCIFLLISGIHMCELHVHT